jgi:hypothetical protein
MFLINLIINLLINLLILLILLSFYMSIIINLSKSYKILKKLKNYKKIIYSC